jgi:hypothetical protein
LRERIYQIVAGYKDANDAERLLHDPVLQNIADQKLSDALGSQPTLSRWENARSGRDLVRLNDALLRQFLRLCGNLRRCLNSAPVWSSIWSVVLGKLRRSVSVLLFRPSKLVQVLKEFVKNWNSN